MRAHFRNGGLDYGRRLLSGAISKLAEVLEDMGARYSAARPNPRLQSLVKIIDLESPSQAGDSLLQ